MLVVVNLSSQASAPDEQENPNCARAPGHSSPSAKHNSRAVNVHHVKENADLPRDDAQFMQLTTELQVVLIRHVVAEKDTRPPLV